MITFKQFKRKQRKDISSINTVGVAVQGDSDIISQDIKRVRQTNVELCRVVCMLLVLLVHTTYAIFGPPSQWDSMKIGIITLNSFSIIGVNVFVLITGYFSTRFSLRSILKLVYICFFYAVLIGALRYVLGDTFSIRDIVFVSNSNWFISAYIGLCVVSPVLNKFVENCNKKNFFYTILSLIVLQVWYEIVPKLISDFSNGYSILSFCVIYLIGRYIKIYGVADVIRNNSFKIYVAISLLSTILTIIFTKAGFHADYFNAYITKYNNPLIILSSVCFFLTFISINISYTSIVNHLAKSCIAVLIVHTTPFINRYYQDLFRCIYSMNNGLPSFIVGGGNCYFNISSYIVVRPN